MRRNTTEYSVTLLCSHHFSTEKLIATPGRTIPALPSWGRILPLPAQGSHWAPGSPPASGAIHLGRSLFIRPDSPVAMATLARQCLNLRQLGMSGLEIPFCLISHQRGCFQAEKFRRSVLSYVPGSCILSFPTKQDLTSSWHLRSGVCIQSLSPAGQVILRAGFSSFCFIIILDQWKSC